jgi:hypothetical protein
MILDDFPKIREAILMIAHDNGCINRLESVEEVLKKCDMSLIFGVISCRDELVLAESELARLSEADFEMLCIGNETESLCVVENHNTDRANRLLNHFWGVICG